MYRHVCECGYDQGTASGDNLECWSLTSTSLETVSLCCTLMDIQANWLRSFQRFCFCLLSFCRRTGIIDARYLYGTYMDLYGSSGSELGSSHLCCKHFTRRFISILFFETFAHSLGWLWIPYLPVSASWVLEILACDTMLCLCGAKDQTKGFVHTR